MRNYLVFVPTICLLLLFALLGLATLPDLQIGEISLEKPKLPSGLMIEAKQPKINSKIPVVKRTTLEDFSPSKTGLNSLFNGLGKTKNDVFRIAFFGDSFVEGDILTANLRDTLQALYGGRGVGYVPITSIVSQFRASVNHTFSGFSCYSILSKNKAGEWPMSGYGQVCIPEDTHKLEYKTSPPFGAKSFDDLRLFYQTKLPASVQINGNTFSLETNKSILKVPLGQASVSLQFSGKPALYGVSFESKNGIILDNFSVRGASGLHLGLASEKAYSALQAQQNYGLIILQFGLNVENPKDSSYLGYVKEMTTLIQQLKKVFPKTSIVLWSVSDRSVRDNSGYTTKPSIARLALAQRKIAQSTGIVFWNLYETMLLKAPMPVLVKKGYANKDYTHLKYKGGKIIAGIFARELLNSKKIYEKPLDTDTSP